MTPTQILLVEDNPADARLVRELLSEDPAAQFTLQHVETLDRALRFLEQCAPGAIVLDLNLADTRASIPAAGCSGKRRGRRWW